MPEETESVSSGAQDIPWDASIERMLANWCDEAKCFEWMHSVAHSQYDSRNKCLIISSNIITAVAGLSNVIAGGYSVNGFQASWVFGSMSIVISILNMIQEKMAYATLAANFLQYSTTWGIIRRKIEEELALPVLSRKNCGTFLQSIRQDTNQVSLAGNCIIPESIKRECFNKFNKIPDFEVPEICGDMSHTAIYKAIADSTVVPLLTTATSPVKNTVVIPTPKLPIVIPPPAKK